MRLCVCVGEGADCGRVKMKFGLREDCGANLKVEGLVSWGVSGMWKPCVPSMLTKFVIDLVAQPNAFAAPLRVCCPARKEIVASLTRMATSFPFG